ncbi:chymotrypsin-like protease CTRL-1 [Drosophila serrata]|uniref:chymotrypsin-like protease CTRL-1 n=1 Tax=Drosophila serrata TaxID=7274 RepID=UPI000A1D1477|nr:chymotrypsin-like protease CTRL-1 [Drosophila serrata]
MKMFLWTILISVLMIYRSTGRMLEENCGSSLVRSKVVNGQNAEREAASWMAAIRNTERFICGGTVIHRNFVLTAAHCIEGQSNLFVMLGAYNKSNPAQEYSVSLAVIHNGFSIITLQNDIGLLKTSQDIQFGFDVYPICIILHPMMKSRVDSMETFEGYGWGNTKRNQKSELLQQITLQRYNRSWCNRYLRNNPLTSNQLCAGSWNGDTCQGDSGGPLTKKIPINGQEIQVQVAIGTSVYH